MSSSLIIFMVIIGFFIFTASNQKKTKETPEDIKPEVPDTGKYQYAAKPLMTPNEFEFFNRLVQAYPNHHVFSQVSMGAVLDIAKCEGKYNSYGRNTFDRKIIDYVIFDKNNSIAAIIELDDKSHVKAKDDKRDAMLLQAGYKLLRFNSTKKPSIEELKELI